MPMALAGECIMDSDVPVRFKPSKFPALNIQKIFCLSFHPEYSNPTAICDCVSSVSTTKAPRSKEFGPTYASQFLPKILPTIDIIACSILKIHAPHNISQSKNVAKHLFAYCCDGSILYKVNDQKLCRIYDFVFITPECILLVLTNYFQ